MADREQRREDLKAALQDGSLLKARGPEGVDAALSELEAYKWQDDNIDTSPVPTEARDFTYQGRGNTPRFPGERGAFERVAVDPSTLPLSNEDRQVWEAAQSGVNLFDSGIDLKSRMKMAASIDHPETQKKIVQKALFDAGVADPAELPPGQDVFKIDEHTGRALYLRKQEDGKYRWTGVNALGLDASDFGEVANLDDALGGLGAMVGAAAGFAGGPAGAIQGEFAGSLAGRTLGASLQQIYTSLSGNMPDDYKFEDFTRELNSQVGLSVLETAFTGGMIGLSKLAEKFVQNRFGGVNADTFLKTQDDIQEALEATATDLETIRAGSDRGRGEIKLTLGEATGDNMILATQQSRAQRASAKEKIKNEVRQEANRQAVVDYVVRNTDAGVEARAPYLSESTEKIVAKHNATIENNLREVGEIYDERATHRNGDKLVTYKLKGVDDLPSIKEGVEPHLVTIRRDDPYGGPGRAEVSHAGTGGAKGAGGEMYRRFIREAMDEGYTPTSDTNMVSQDAINVWKSLEREGYGIEVSSDLPDTPITAYFDENNELTPLGEQHFFLADIDANGKKSFTRRTILEGEEIPFSDAMQMEIVDPAFTVRSKPGEKADNFLESMSDNYDQALLDSELEVVADNFANQAIEVENLRADAMADIGWNRMRQESGFTMDNPLSPQGRLGQVMRKLQLKSENSVSRGRASGAERMLQDLFQDGEFASMADPEVDVGQVVKALDHLHRIRDRGGIADPDVMDVINGMEAALRNNKWFHRTDPGFDTGPVQSSFVSDYAQAQRAEELYNQAGSAFTANELLKRGIDGRFTNTSVQSLKKVLRNDGSPASLRVAIERNPNVREQTGQALLQLWNRTARKGGKFSPEAHEAFISDYSDAIDMTFGRDVKERFRVAPDALQQAQNKSEARFDNVRRMLQEEAGNENKPLKGVNLSTNSIYKSLAGMKPGKRKALKSLLEGTKAPFAKGTMWDSVLAEAKRDVGVRLRRIVGKSGDYDQMADFLNKDGKFLKQEFGEDWYNGMWAVQRTLKRMVNGVTAVAPDSQPIWLRMARTAMGPLSKKQRFITSANFWAHRLMAKNILNVMSDPDQFRTFRLYKAKGVDNTYTRPAIAGWMRLGVFDGVPMPEDPEEQVQYVNELMSGIESEWEASTGSDSFTGSGEAQPQTRTAPAGSQSRDITRPDFTSELPQATPRAQRPVNTNQGGSIAERRARAIQASEADLAGDEQNRRF